MSKRKVQKNYRKSKGVKTDSPLTALKGSPNTNLDTREKLTGKLVSRRKYDKKGNAYLDMDAPHKNHNKKNHSHDIVGSDRKSARDMTKKEKVEFEKAGRKRKLWN